MHFTGMLLLVSMALIEAHGHDGLCSQVCQYCKDQESIIQSTGRGVARIGKAGPRGPPGIQGEPGVVDYTKVNEEMLIQLEETESRIDEKLKILSQKMMTNRKGCEMVHKFDAKFWNSSGGLFMIYPTRTEEGLEVYCDLTTDGGGWTVFQRRMDGSVDFYLGWDDYVNGFGEKNKEFWMGLESIHQLTKGGAYELRIYMEDWEGNSVYAHYGTFAVGDSSTGFKLTVGDYSGTAGDSLVRHNGMKFTTKDLDQDTGSTRNCAVVYKGAWWHYDCHQANLNGVYLKGTTVEFAIGVVWKSWKEYHYSLKFVEMMFRKK